MKFERSIELFKKAKKYFVGGVNSPVRSFKSVSANPLFIERGVGSKIYDVDGNEYIDYVLAYGPLILGHSNEKVIEYVSQTLRKGIHFGACHKLEIELAELIVSAFKNIEKIRFVNSGTEAIMSAVRLARAYTKRNKIIKFAGNYHGHSDYLLVKGGSGILTHSIATSEGVPDSMIQDTIVLDYNNIEQVNEVFKNCGEQIACVIVEPIAGNMGVVVPSKNFLTQLREITKKYEAVLIFDEVITGFRFNFGGLSNEYLPDLTILGKIIGGGFPIGAYGGSAKIMDLLSPEGAVYQAGTFSANPISLAGGIATLQTLKSLNPYPKLDEYCTLLKKNLMDSSKKYSIPLVINQYNSMMTIFFTEVPVYDYYSALKSNTKMYASFFKLMIEKGVYLPPSQFEAMFVSTMHSDDDLEKTAKAAEFSFQNIEK